MTTPAVLLILFCILGIGGFAYVLISNWRR